MSQDLFLHPKTPAEVAELVTTAKAQGRQLRVRGSVHSVAHAIYPDGDTKIPNKVGREEPPPGKATNVMLDQLTTLTAIDADRGIFEAGAGLWLWYDPNDPSKRSRPDNGLLPQLATLGWTLPDLGGITHQTIGGFLSTGSSGGSLTWDALSAVIGLTLVDGNGDILDLAPGDDLFDAALVSMGLLGVIVAARLQCVKMFWIDGTESITTLEKAPVDLLGPGTPSQPSLVNFLTATEYTRLEWWPQPGAQRLVTWQAKRLPPGTYTRKPYEEFTNQPVIAETAMDLILVILGNLSDPDKAEPLFARHVDKLGASMKYLFHESKLTWMQELLGILLKSGGEGTAYILVGLIKLFKSQFEQSLPALFHDALNVFMPLDTKGPQAFRDTAWQGLPMDNGADDNLVPVEFTEMWMPLSRASEAVNLLNDWWSVKDEQEALARTGTFAWEVYATKPNSAWLSPAFSTGAADDPWRDGAFRIDPYWFKDNSADPCDGFYLQFWNLVRQAGIPYRLHWGKFQPKIEIGDPDGWVAFFSAQYPRWKDFLGLRDTHDPSGVFLTHYWRDRFGIRGGG